MWLVAPDGLCVGTGHPRPCDHGDDQRGEPARAFLVGKSTTDLWRTPMVRTTGPLGPPGCAPVDTSRRVTIGAPWTMPPSPSPTTGTPRRAEWPVGRPA